MINHDLGSSDSDYYFRTVWDMFRLWGFNRTPTNATPFDPKEIAGLILAL